MSLIDLLGRGFGLVEPSGTTLPPLNTPIDPQTTSTVGCTDPHQQPAYIVPASFGGVLNWTVRDNEGNPITVTDPGLPPEEDITHKWDRIVMFHDPFCVKSLFLGRLAVNGQGGLLAVPPPCVQQTPGIYQMEVHWSEPELPGSPPTPERFYYGTSLVSVEDSIYNRAVTGGKSGPLPLSRIRAKLRDYGGLNDVSGFPEYSLEEILSAMLEPVEYYNEALPMTSAYSPQNFPFHQQWLDATVAKLLQTTGLWMMRNQVTIQGEGVGSDDRNKWSAMIQLGDRMWRDYRLFVRSDKVRHNIEQGFGII